MKIHTTLTSLSVLAWTIGCGSHSSNNSQTQPTQAKDPNAVDVNQVDQAQLEEPANLIACRNVNSESMLCSFKPNIHLLSGLSAVGESGQLTFKYTLLCAGIEQGSMTDIAIKSDSQIVRLKANVVDQLVSIANESGGLVDLARVTSSNTTEALEGTSSCWFFRIDAVNDATTAADATQQGTSQDQGQQAAQQGAAAGTEAGQTPEQQGASTATGTPGQTSGEQQQGAATTTGTAGQTSEQQQGAATSTGTTGQGSQQQQGAPVSSGTEQTSGQQSSAQQGAPENPAQQGAPESSAQQGAVQ